MIAIFLLTFALHFDIIISRYNDIKRGVRMNNSDVSTYEKIMIPLRLPPDLYQKMNDKVQKEKKKQRGYSINQFLTSLIEKDLEEK